MVLQFALEGDPFPVTMNDEFAEWDLYEPVPIEAITSIYNVGMVECGLYHYVTTMKIVLEEQECYYWVDVWRRWELKGVFKDKEAF